MAGKCTGEYCCIFEDHVVYDLYSIEGIHESHFVASTMEEAAVQALSAGVDIDLGGDAFMNLLQAVRSGKLDETQICKTITSHMKFDCNMYIHPWEARGLSPREAARIQTFPDDYVITGSQNIWYAQIGNAVPVKLAKAIGEGIIKFLR